MTVKPTKAKEEFVADERAAERRVVEAEYELLKAQQTNDPKKTAAAQKAVDGARIESLKIRAAMVDGLAAWHQYDSDVELERTKRELGLM